MAMISNDWLPALKDEFRKPYYAKLFSFVKEEYATHVVYPPADDIFNAFHFTPLREVKVVILGQDPYHNEHQAHGLCFSVQPGEEVPPSLVNIYQELHDDLGCYIPNNGYLEKWAKQGVLMLNTVLTVRAHQANSHQGKGWEQFTDAVIEAVNAQDRPIVFLLWGRPAQQKASMLTNPQHLILKAPHPSPSTPGLSSLDSNNSCKPRQIPRNGVFLSTISEITSIRPYSFNFPIASPNAPTPGRMTFSAASSCFGSRVSIVSSCKYASAFWTLFTFPAS